MINDEELTVLKKQRDAVILAHYYAAPEVQDIADYVGDSFYLSKVAAGIKCRTIIFAGVRFMGECAKILNPQKDVLMPDDRADCFMAHMIDNEFIKKCREKYDDLAVVCYVNSTTETKVYSDVCVTSSNAVNIVRKLPNKNILFIPDKNLGRHVAMQVPEKHFIFNDGFCPIHEHMRASEISTLKKLHPQAKVLAHPECNEDVIKLADYIGSTSGILNYAAKSDDKEFIIATEIGIRHKLMRANAEKNYYFPETVPKCLNMKLNTLDSVIKVLKNGGNAIQVDEKLAGPARKTLVRMLELA
ncbi:quinolinate synthase NadA [Pectinatus cerevisiiphilus]|uniref:Quinolinate synthase n=1 Tax=Pectinatus cerevisiiphilus TaxID=86956 RepID=A0A4R3K310_9FIRM|nr:quinolinate synthase NadA [Pectinatus cerevisiiphilus]TCS77049.1 quinolinate synthetase [Pectinatus cerevisiiphilus]